MWLWGHLIWLYGAFQRHSARALVNSGLQMSSLHMYDPRQRSTAQSIKRQLQPRRLDLSLPLHILYHVFCLPLLALFWLRVPPMPPHSSLHCNILQWLAQTADSQRWQKCFYIFTHKCFASCSWCGGGPHVTMEGDEDIEAQLWG